MKFTCYDKNALEPSEQTWISEIRQIEVRENHCEMDVTGRGSSFHIIFGQSSRGGIHQFLTFSLTFCVRVIDITSYSICSKKRSTKEIAKAIYLSLKDMNIEADIKNISHLPYLYR